MQQHCLYIIWYIIRYVKKKIRKEQNTDKKQKKGVLIGKKIDCIIKSENSCSFRKKEILAENMKNWQ